MPYYVSKLKEYEHHLKLTDFWEDDDYLSIKVEKYLSPKASINSTRTRFSRDKNARGISWKEIYKMIAMFQAFYKKYGHLYSEDMSSMYHEFYIPKQNGKLRQINAPNDELKTALRELIKIIDNIMNGCTYHTSAFAYVKGRSTTDAVKKHQANSSRWFVKFDYSDFFGSINLAYAMKMFAQIAPFNLILATDEGYKVVENCLKMCFLNGKLPQGSPASPMITNIIMIPMDFELTKILHTPKKFGYEFCFQDGEANRDHGLVYTRYADDMCISCRYGFSFKAVEGLIDKVLKKWDAPFKLNREKTHYGSLSGRNWILGVMLNKDNEITIGHRKKKNFKSALNNYMYARQSDEPWSISEIQHFYGVLAYYKSIEKKGIEAIIAQYSRKFGVDDIEEIIKSDLRVG